MVNSVSKSALLTYILEQSEKWLHLILCWGKNYAKATQIPSSALMVMEYGYGGSHLFSLK